jgi:hypothetical protein
MCKTESTFTASRASPSNSLRSFCLAASAAGECVSWSRSRTHRPHSTRCLCRPDLGLRATSSCSARSHASCPWQGPGRECTADAARARRRHATMPAATERWRPRVGRSNLVENTLKRENTRICTSREWGVFCVEHCGSYWRPKQYQILCILHLRG